MLTSVDGIGSRGQDLRAEFWISCLTSRTDSIVKVGNDGTVSSKTADADRCHLLEVNQSHQEQQTECHLPEVNQSAEQQTECHLMDMNQSAGW